MVGGGETYQWGLAPVIGEKKIPPRGDEEGI